VGPSGCANPASAILSLRSAPGAQPLTAAASVKPLAPPPPSPQSMPVPGSPNQPAPQSPQQLTGHSHGLLAPAPHSAPSASVQASQTKELLPLTMMWCPHTVCQYPTQQHRGSSVQQLQLSRHGHHLPHMYPLPPARVLHKTPPSVLLDAVPSLQHTVSQDTATAKQRTAMLPHHMCLQLSAASNPSNHS
jgi:hypothetical protein